MEQIKAWPLEYHNPAALDALPEAARKLIVALLHPEPDQRLGATSEGYAGLKRHPFFTSTGSSDTHQPAAINFDELTSRPPPPLIPPPPLPSIMTDGSVLNGQLAKRGPLSPLERTPLLASQSGVRWSALLDKDSSELLVLSTLVTKRRHLSAKRRQLILAEGLLVPTAAASSSPSGGAAGAIAPRTPKAQNGSSSPQSDSTPTTQLAAVDITDSSSSSSGASGGASGGSGAFGGASGGGEGVDATSSPSGCLPSCCRLFYVDPTTLEHKGTIPWSSQLHAELLPKGQFRIHTPNRTYAEQQSSSIAAALPPHSHPPSSRCIHTGTIWRTLPATPRSRSYGCRRSRSCRQGRCRPPREERCRSTRSAMTDIIEATPIY